MREYGTFLHQFCRDKQSVYMQGLMNEMIACECPQGRVYCFSSINLHKQKTNIKTFAEQLPCYSLNGRPPRQNLVWWFTTFKFLKKHYTWPGSNWWTIVNDSTVSSFGSVVFKSWCRNLKPGNGRRLFAFRNKFCQCAIIYQLWVEYYPVTLKFF